MVFLLFQGEFQVDLTGTGFELTNNTQWAGHDLVITQVR
jgi:hypothetical protein